MRITKKIVLQITAFILCLCPALAAAAADTAHVSMRIDRYRLQATIDPSKSTLKAEAQIWVRAVEDSIAQIQFYLPAPLEFLSARDSLDSRYDRKIIDRKENSKEIIIFLEHALWKNDSIYVRILYEAEYDTISTFPAFIGENEFLLSARDGTPWWPMLGHADGLVFQDIPESELIIEAPSSFGVVAVGAVDTTNRTERLKQWKFTRSTKIPVQQCFLAGGAKNLSKLTYTNADSTIQISFYSVQRFFNEEYAKELTRLLGEAAEYFVSATVKPSALSDLRFLMIGTDDQSTPWITTDGLVIGHCSSAYAMVDTEAFSLSSRNPWVHELAHLFALPSTDSTFLFNEGWVSYLSTKYFFARIGPAGERRERIDVLMQAVDFYPTYPLAQGRKTYLNERAVFSKKGTYIFLMLEYILGEQIFAEVRKTLYDKYFHTPVSFAEFRRLCEDAYGSDLEWFFREWIERTGFPELVLNADVKMTNRGSYSVKARITQRGDIFTMPVDIVLTNGVRQLTKRLFVTKQDQTFEIVLPFYPALIELDPNYRLLRWVPRLRLLAHARTSVSYRVFNHDLANSEREAMLMLQLDPNNNTGWNSMAMFSLGKVAVIRDSLKLAEDFFRKASTAEVTEPAQLYPVLSLVRLGNVLEMQDRRQEALQLYELAISAGERNPAVYAPAMYEAQKYLKAKFTPVENFWYGRY